eukprot:8523243-Alexandrium_andersonii.AAC.1
MGGEGPPQNLRAVLCEDKGAADEISDIAKDRGLVAQVALLLPAAAEGASTWGEARHFPARLPDGTLGVAPFRVAPLVPGQ